MAGRNAKPVIKSACLPSIPKDFAAVVSDCIYILTHEIGPDCTQIGFHVTLPNRRLRTWICVGASQKPYLDLVWRSDQSASWREGDPRSGGALFHMVRTVSEGELFQEQNIFV
jgi:hypothetical protein